MVDAPPSVIIAAKTAPLYAGGLAAYQRTLARLLSEHAQVSFLCEFFRHEDLPDIASHFPWPIVQLRPGSIFTVTHRAWPSLASRPPFHAILRFLLSRAWMVPADFRPERIHFIGTGWDLVGFYLASLAERLKIPFTVWPAVHPEKWGDDRIDIALFRRADAVFCQSDYERRHLIRLGVPESKLRNCGLPPMVGAQGDAPGFRLRHHLDDRPCVLFLGRRDKGKGFPELAGAWERVLRKCPGAVLLLGGPRILDEREWLAGLPSDSFCDLGLLGDQEKSDAFAACDVFCLPSSDEAFGIVYVEAWSFAKPVICGTAPATRELVENGVTGLWAEKDPCDLAEKILRLLSDPAERLRLGEAGRAVQRSLYTERRFLEQHLEAFEMPSACA